MLLVSCSTKVPLQMMMSACPRSSKVPVICWCLFMTLGLLQPSYSLRPGHTCPKKWQEDYTRQHQAIMDGTAAPEDRRYAISVSSPAGIADRLTGCITVFYYALLTGRAFCEHAAIPGQIPFEAAYLAPNIDWSTSEHHSQMLPIHKAGDTGLPDAKGESFQHFNILNPEYDSGKDEVFKLFSSGNLSDLGRDAKIVFITTNRGASVRLFENPYHRQQLRKMGLTPGTAFGCAMNFLFKPIPEVMRLITPTMHLLAQRPSVGIHIRVGDHALHGSDVARVEEFANYFDCANEVDLAFFPEAEDVIWIVLSDSKSLRRHASEVYGDKVHILSANIVEHSFGGSGNETPYASLDGFWAAVGEHWVLGVTDIQVIDNQSGFGLTAAMRTYEDNHIFVLGHGEHKQCQKGNGAMLYNLGTFRAGVK